MKLDFVGFLILVLFVILLFVPTSLSISVTDNDYTSNFTTISNGGTNSTSTDLSGLSTIGQTGYGQSQSTDLDGEMGLMYLLEDNVAPIIYLETPGNNTVNITDRTPDFTFNVSDADNHQVSCVLWMNNGTSFTAGSDSSVLNATSTVIISTKELSDDIYWWWVNCSDGVDWNVSSNRSLEILISNTTLQITRIFSPDTVMAGENETVSVNTTVKIADTTYNVYQVNMTDDVPWDFTAPSDSDVRVYFYDYSEGITTEITTNATVSVSIVDQSGSDPTLVMVNITNISRTDADGYLQNSDYIRLIYDMTSSEMDAADYRVIYTNVTVSDNQSFETSDFLMKNLTSFNVVLRGYKYIYVPDPNNPQNFTVDIRFRALGGPTTGFYISDYLPDGAQIADHNVSIWNNSRGEWVQLYNSSDYYIDLDTPFDDVLPGGENVDVYFYNLSYAFTNWDGNLYDNDTIRIDYNVSVVGGGSWVLPTIPAAWDPTYKKHIKTEINTELNIPLFDVEVTLLTKSLDPGGIVTAVLKLLNVGGPKARVDVVATYSIKTMQGDLITEATDTFAVTSEKEKELILEIPDDIKPGRYTFEVLITYTGREAISTRVFEVLGGIDPGFPIIENLIYIVVAAMIIMFLMYFRLGRKVGRVEYRSPYRT
jgi:hypothetical protein